MHLARFPRVRLFPSPTPLERLDNLTRRLGGPEIWIKRDDCTVVATGGNKVRKLEFLVGEALALGADHLVTQGAVQSNHVRQTAAVAAMHGLKCTALLEHRIMPYVDRVVIAVPQNAQARVRQLIERLEVLPNEVMLFIDQGPAGRAAALQSVWVPSASRAVHRHGNVDLCCTVAIQASVHMAGTFDRAARLAGVLGVAA